MFHRDLQFGWRLLKYGGREKQTQLVKEYAVICIFYSEMTNLRKQGDLRDKNIDFSPLSGVNKALFLQHNLWSLLNSHQLLCHNQLIFCFERNNKKKQKQQDNARQRER